MFQRLIDKTKVTCIKWIPASPNQFLVSHASGHMYVYNEEMPCGTTPPHYQPFKQGEGYSITTCKTKSTRNPLYRWVVGHGAINEFGFSPCGKYLAVVGQDGYLRVFNYDSMDLVGTMKSYFGGLLCVCWSPDGKFIVTGGEDDLVTVWCVQEKRVVCRGEGHRSWVNVVAFDMFTSCVPPQDCDFTATEEDGAHTAKNSSNHTSPPKEHQANNVLAAQRAGASSANRNSGDGQSLKLTSYRFGSVGQDTMLCLWDLTEDVIRTPVGRTRTSTLISQNAFGLPARSNSLPHSQKVNCVSKDSVYMDGNIPAAPNALNITPKFATLSLGEKKDKDNHDKKEHKRNFSLASRSSDKVNLMKANHVRPVDESIKLLGTPACPRLDDIPVLEPLICKKVAHERLTSLVFREECIVTACQEGCVYTWARPGKVVSENGY